MLEAKKKMYKKAYTELNEVFKIMTEEELNKIPKEFISNVQKEMDKEYVCKLDKNKPLLEQHLLTETKALVVEIYERYLCPENEKEMWRKYDNICLNKIEEQRKKEYNSDDLFKRKHTSVVETQNLDVVEYKKENFLIKMIKRIKNIFVR